MAEARDWDAILKRARTLAGSNGTLTLRELYERLAQEGLLRVGNRADYVYLSDRTAAERRKGEFPALAHGQTVRVGGKNDG